MQAARLWILLNFEFFYSNGDVLPSAPSRADSLEPAEPTEHRRGRLRVTFWSTVSSTFTFVSTSVNTANTFSVSFLCSVAGTSFPAACR